MLAFSQLFAIAKAVKEVVFSKFKIFPYIQFLFLKVIYCLTGILFLTLTITVMINHNLTTSKTNYIITEL